MVASFHILNISFLLPHILAMTRLKMMVECWYYHLGNCLIYFCLNIFLKITQCLLNTDDREDSSHVIEKSVNGRNAIKSRNKSDAFDQEHSHSIFVAEMETTKIRMQKESIQVAKNHF